MNDSLGLTEEDQALFRSTPTKRTKQHVYPHLITEDLDNRALKIVDFTMPRLGPLMEETIPTVEPETQYCKDSHRDSQRDPIFSDDKCHGFEFSSETIVKVS